ncbi:hypothetical protein AQPE_0436 [Aquipluma nitroreducens]|uniref:Uncharacterized protein n=2 Tax=Aquipluma nitroreducens TaxID=2010828 RepID=A0A5K7S473_9BACT|nr:hypothetical protein AQPE_0436 [Aquipluma nitroreducens]
MMLAFSGSVLQAQTRYQKPDDFIFDLGSSNNKLKGNLLLSGIYKDDLTQLTYEKYLIALKESEKSSNQGLAEVIRKADQHFFTTKEKSFLIAIYSKEFNLVLFDDAVSQKTDSVVHLPKGGTIPDLSEFAKKSKFFNN